MFRKTVIVAVVLLAGASAANAGDLNAAITASTPVSTTSADTAAMDGLAGFSFKLRKRFRKRFRPRIRGLSTAKACTRYKRKAMHTGRHYYWAKYHRCLRGRS